MLNEETVDFLGSYLKKYFLKLALVVKIVAKELFTTSSLSMRSTVRIYRFTHSSFVLFISKLGIVIFLRG